MMPEDLQWLGVSEYCYASFFGASQERTNTRKESKEVLFMIKEDMVFTMTAISSCK